jgi:hypothetical protein
MSPDNPLDDVPRAARRNRDTTQRTQQPTNVRPGEAPEQPDHSMHDEEPMGWDRAPQDIRDPQQKRHPRKEGKGGLPDPRD